MNSKRPPLTRRTFMISTATGIVTASAGVRAAPPIRAGLIGCGDAGRSLLHTADTRDMPLKIVAAADTDPQRLAQFSPALKTTSSWEALLEEQQLDALLIATPDLFHAPMAHAALTAGKHVYLVPPFARSTQEAQALQHTATGYPGRLHIAMDRTTLDHWSLGKSEVTRCQMGTLRWIQADLPNPPQRPRSHWSHQYSMSHGDAARTLFSSLYSLIRIFRLGKPQSCDILGGTFEDNGRETPDTLSFSAEFREGLRVTLTTKPSETGAMPTVIRGNRGSIEISAPKAAASTSIPNFDLGPWAHSLYARKNIPNRSLEAALVAQSALCNTLKNWNSQDSTL